MGPSGSSDSEDVEAVQKAIMEATYRALCTHGGTNLTTQAIADEFDKSKSLIFYHYNSKEDLLTSFLDYLLDRFEERVSTAEIDDPAEQLSTLIDALLFGPEDHESFQIALLELRSQAPYNDAYQEQFRTNDEWIQGVLVDVIERGIKTGTFQAVEPNRFATIILTAIEGARTRWLVLDDDEVLDTVADDLQRRIEDELFVKSTSASEL